MLECQKSWKSELLFFFCLEVAILAGAVEDYDICYASNLDDIHSLYCIYNAAWINKDQLTSDSCMAQTRCTSSVVRYLEIDM